eukprot:scaffold72916_cov67-Phaeocystis_antarctica.AAC.4
MPGCRAPRPPRWLRPRRGAARRHLALRCWRSRQRAARASRRAADSPAPPAVPPLATAFEKRAAAAAAAPAWNKARRRRASHQSRTQPTAPRAPSCSAPPAGRPLGREAPRLSPAVRKAAPPPPSRELGSAPHQRPPAPISPSCCSTPRQAQRARLTQRGPRWLAQSRARAPMAP